MAPVATPFFFYLLAATMIIGGILVITRKNAVHSALALITTLLAQAVSGTTATTESPALMPQSAALPATRSPGRATAAGKQKRNGQSRRYRKRVRKRKPPGPEAVAGAARVITQEHFFRPHLRPAGLLRALERVQERERRWREARI